MGVDEMREMFEGLADMTSGTRAERRHHGSAIDCERAYMTRLLLGLASFVDSSFERGESRFLFSARVSAVF